MTERIEAERRLAQVARRHQSRRTALEEAEAERDEAIRAAFDADVPRKRIADLAGVSLQRVFQIRAGTR